MSFSPEKIAKDLRGVIKGRVLTDRISRTLYATDASIFRIMPAAVVEPIDIGDVQALIKYARHNKVPLSPRGAGSGLAGESLTSGIVMDFSVHFRESNSLDDSAHRVTVQPGVVHGELNSKIKKFGKVFGPDPATSNRCTLGGMISNNSTGAHSLLYGMTDRWVRSLSVMLSDGSVARFKPYRLDSGEFQRLVEAPTLEGSIYREIIPLLKAGKTLIDSTWPSSPRNRHGYLLKHVLNGETIDLTKLFCASEGTLGVLLDAELESADLPKASALVSFSFKNRLSAAEATPHLLKFNPSAIELIDNCCLDMARQIPTYSRLYGSEVDSVLLVEFFGDSPEELRERVESSIDKVHGNYKLSCDVDRCDSKERKAVVWEMRKHISGMINRVPGRLQPAAIIEDACVNPNVLASYLDGVEKILGKKNIRYLCFGHAGDGTVHIRPFIDRKDPQIWQQLPDICSEIYDLTLKLGGTISGEHGDGLLRAPFMRKQYGQLVDTFKSIKRLFDPDDIMNPGKKPHCEGFEAWRTNLRFSSVGNAAKEFQLHFDTETLDAQIEACNGCGACRSKLKDGAMCPVFRALGLEIAATRAKGNLMRALLYGELTDEDLLLIKQAADYCITCKSCMNECPASFDAAPLMLEVKARYAKRFGLPADVRILSAIESFLPFAAPAAPVINQMAKSETLRSISSIFTGLSAERTPPSLTSPFNQRHRNLSKSPSSAKSDRPRVAFFTDMFANWFDNGIAESFLAIMENFGIEVCLPKQKSCGIVQLNYGNVRDARDIALYNVEKLSPYVKEGFSIVCTEPTAALMLSEEYLLLDRSEKTKRVAKATVEATSFLWSYLKDGIADAASSHRMELSLGYHTPCHMKAVSNGQPHTPELMHLIPGIKVASLSEGCCGIAGTYGMRCKGYETSMRIGAGLFEALNRPEFDYGLTECSTCRMQMEHGVPNKKTLHPVELLAAAIGRKSAFGFAENA